ncbi:hypothetical protein GCM10010211_43630 [Streptomyces albospinus]|uniref:Uncharacterized protein n=1 Tax=Streptomyces albospinus TaxID=285515 RepID=A0ABQ2VAT6_9ACTN|nr:hypothetical protein GCM10010211_43630 [Streptomyces albospinus]
MVVGRDADRLDQRVVHGAAECGEPFAVGAQCVDADKWHGGGFLSGGTEFRGSGARADAAALPQRLVGALNELLPRVRLKRSYILVGTGEGVRMRGEDAVPLGSLPPLS